MAELLDVHGFKELLLHFGRPWRGYRKVRKGVIKRIRQHMVELGCSNVADYISIIEKNPEEYEKCQAHLRVTISRFFRDRQVWQVLESRVLPELVSRFPGRIEAWSAGCACGEEPYSLSILRHRLQLHELLHISASDGDPVCLARARQGIYQTSSLKELRKLKEQAPDLIDSCFARLPKSRYAIRDHLKSNIDWCLSDLLDGPFREEHHLIFLRNNLLTYYQQPQLGPACERIVETLLPGGYLVIGAHERLPEMSLQLSRNSHCPLIYKRLS